MKTIKIVIEKTKDHYSAYAENVEGVYGAGESIAEAKESILHSIKLLKEHNEANLTKELKEEIELMFEMHI